MVSPWRSPHERSDMRGLTRCCDEPGCRFAHPGYVLRQQVIPHAEKSTTSDLLVELDELLPLAL
ncbi:hypothetical protein BRAS3809_2700009 [Bradyrhizobium sp. STM 3809]|nr:hypothetical protein BRAS3809_2700009 [Bradyrhizobium sp. STM 3809]